MPEYTAIKKNPRVEDGVFKIDVDILADGGLVKTVTYETDQPQLDTWPGQLVRADIKKIEFVAMLPTNITAGNLPIPPDTAPPPPPAKVAWLADMRRLRVIQEAVSSGAIQANDSRVTALKNRLKTMFDASYLDFG